MILICFVMCALCLLFPENLHDVAKKLGQVEAEMSPENISVTVMPSHVIINVFQFPKVENKLEGETFPREIQSVFWSKVKRTCLYFLQQATSSPVYFYLFN